MLHDLPDMVGPDENSESRTLRPTRLVEQDEFFSQTHRPSKEGSDADA